jgi:hypothetical protein
MPQRFDRDLVVNIGGIELRMRQAPTISRNVDGELVQELGESREILRVVFKVKKTGKTEPNQCALEIYNLSPAHRQIVEDDGADVLIQAGYTGALSQIFKGDLSYGDNERSGPDWITTIEAADGARPVRRGRVQAQTAAGATVETVMQTLADTLDLDVGNLAQKLSEGNFRQGFEDFKTGRVLSGKSWEEVKRLSRSLGLEVSVQDEAFQFLRPGEATNEGSAIVDQSTGLIGSPERGDKGIVKITTLLRPQINPGRRIRLTSAQLDGDYLCQSIIHTGDTHGQKWYSEIEAKRL